jgi:hypothetical protein
MRSFLTLAISAEIGRSADGIDYMRLNPCRLVCHMEHTIDQCKLVESNSAICSNFYWSNAGRDSTVIDRIREDEYQEITFQEAIDILRVGKSGCDKICESHPECVDIGSGCKPEGVCLNLFWIRGQPSRTKMESCYQLAAGGCEDGTPILCGNEVQKAKQEKIESGLPTASNMDAKEEEGDISTPRASTNLTKSVSRLEIILSLLIVPFVTRW